MSLFPLMLSVTISQLTCSSVGRTFRASALALHVLALSTARFMLQPKLAPVKTGMALVIGACASYARISFLLM